MDIHTSGQSGHIGHSGAVGVNLPSPRKASNLASLSLSFAAAHKGLASGVRGSYEMRRRRLERRNVAVGQREHHWDLPIPARPTETMPFHVSMQCMPFEPVS